MLSALKYKSRKFSIFSITILFLVTQITSTLLIILLNTPKASAADTGFFTPTSAHTPNNWDVNNVVNIQTSDNTYASEAGGQEQGYSNFSFPAVTAGSTINGIEVKVEAKSTDNNGCRLGVTLSGNNGTNYTASKYTNLTDNDATQTLGGANDLWGGSWSVSSFTNANFVLKIEDNDPGSNCTSSATTSVDLLQAKVFYTEPVPQPDLVAVKTNNVSGQATNNVPFTWTVRVQNNGAGAANFSNNQEIFRDNRSSDKIASYGSTIVTKGPGVTGTTNCSENGTANRDLTCTASGAVTVPAGAYVDFSYTATPNATGTVDNPRSGGECKVDKNNVVSNETNENNNTCSNSVNVNINTGTPNPQLSQSCGLDVALVIDSSLSIDSGELAQMKSAYISFVNAFLPATPTKFSVTEFDTTATVTQAFTDNVSSLTNTINSASSGGFTNWEDALIKAQSTFDPRPSKPNLVVFASDGNPNTVFGGGGGGATESQAVNAAATIANSIKASGTRIVALGIGSDLNVDNLKAISGPTVGTGIGSDVITSDFANLADDLAALADSLCGGTVTVKKMIDADGNPNTTNDRTPAENWSFDVNGSPSNPAPVLTDIDGFTPSMDVDPGTYSVNESQKNNYVLLSASCTGAQNNGSVQGNSIVGLQVAADNIVSCTFVNTEVKGTITVNKVTDPANSQNVFSVTAQGSGAISGNATRNITASQSVVYEVKAGTYYVSETPTPGWYEQSNTCSNLVISSPGQNLTCTITNLQKGSISGLKFKDLNGNGVYDQGEPPMSNWNIFLDTNANGQLDQGELSQLTDANGLYTFMNLMPTTYYLYEVMQNGWTQTLSPGQAVLSPGQVIGDQYFGNFENGSVSGYKFNDKNGNGQKDEDEPKLNGWTINLYTDNDDQDLLLNNLIATENTDQNGNYEFNNLSPGIYQVCEVQQDGWVQTLPANSSCYLINIDQSGETNENTVFGNQARGKLIIIKDVEYDGDNSYEDDQDFDFTLTKYNPIDVILDNLELNQDLLDISEDVDAIHFTLDDDSEDNEHSNQKVFDGFPAGSFVLTEEEVPGWDLKSIICSNEEQTLYRTDNYEDNYNTDGYIHVGPGEEVTCIVTNEDKQPRLTIYKEVINDNGATAKPSDFMLTVTDPSGPSLSFPGSNTGTTLIMSPGEFEVTEQDSKGYTASYEGCQGALEWGDHRVCVVTNNDNVQELNITKTNNRPNPTTVGDVVTYTLNVSVPDNSGPVYNTLVTDLPPDNFEYIPGSYTATSDMRGDLKTLGVTGPPTYASPGNWTLGDMSPGESVVLTYQAAISSKVTPGNYPDLAFASGSAADNGEGPEVLSNLTVADDPFVGTEVDVISPAVAGIFTSREALVNTGSYFPASFAVIPAFLLGLTVYAYRRSRRLSQEGGQR